MEGLLTLENLGAFVTLTGMEIVLGIDNLVFIAILSAKVEPAKQKLARRTGLLLALFGRVALLCGVTVLMGLDDPWLKLYGVFHDGLSTRDLIMLAGGGFLIYKATDEIHDKLEGDRETIHEPRAAKRFASVIAQIVALDVVFSIDSVVTAVGMVRQAQEAPWQPLAIMIAAVTIAILVMLFFSEPIAGFIQRHPTTKMLALAFLLLIGVMLVAEGFGREVPKGYIYSAMAFSLFVELLNLRAFGSRGKKAGSQPSAEG